MAKLTKAKFQHHLQSLTQAELIVELLKLYEKFEPVRQYYEIDSGNSEQIVADYKKKLLGKFKRGGNWRAAKPIELRAIISEFKKLKTLPAEVADVVLFRVECAIKVTLDCQEDYERSPNASFYNATLTAF